MRKIPGTVPRCIEPLVIGMQSDHALHRSDLEQPKIAGRFLHRPQQPGHLVEARLG